MDDRMSPTAPPRYGISPHGFRMPADTRLGAVLLQVGDLERSLDYYRRVLGIDELDRAGGEVRLGAAGGEPLVQLRERQGAAPVPAGGRLGLYHFAILLPTRGDLGRFLRHVRDVGERPGAADHHVSEALYLRDPDGLGIEVYADRPRAAWESDGRELRMATLPLDAPDLLRAAGDAPWSGMPAGTTMGHVHLHVGSLGEAEAFYHRALGLDKTVWSYPGALFLSAGGYHHHLGLNTWAEGAAPAGPDDARLLEWTVDLTNRAAAADAADSLQAAGYAIEPVDDEGFVARDPWGTQLRVRIREPSGSPQDDAERA